MRVARLLGPVALVALAAGCGPARTERPAPAHRPAGGRALTGPPLASAAGRSAPEIPGPASRYPAGIDPARTSRDPTWGYLKENPIKVGGPRGTPGPTSQRLYLRHLRDSNFLAMRFRRAGNVGPGPDGHIIDLYELTGVDGRTYRLHLDMYHPEVNPLDLKAPRGLFFQKPRGQGAPVGPGAVLLARLPRAEGPMRRAEADYRLALALWRELGGKANRRARQRRYLDYVLASQRYLLAAVNYAEGLEADTSRRRACARGAAEAIEGWLVRQREEKYQSPPPGVRMWMYYYLGRARTSAGEVEKACREGFDRALAFNPDKFPTAGSRAWAWQMRLTAAYVKARTLTDAAADEAGWERALAAAGGELLERPESAGRALRVRARILRVRCLVALGEIPKALAEYKAARADIKDLKGSEAKETGRLAWQALQAVGPGRAPAGDATEMATPEVMVRTGLGLYRQKKYAAAVKVWRAAVAQTSGLGFAERVKPEREAHARLYIGIALHRTGRYRQAQQAYAGALVELWEKMPAAFRKDPENKRLIADLKEKVFSYCARNGRIAAEQEKRQAPAKFDEKRLARWREWEKKLGGGK